MISAVDQLQIAPLPCAVGLGIARSLDPIIAEVFEQCRAITVRVVVRNDLAIDRQQGGQVVREREVGWRTIIDGADRHREEVAGGVGALVPHDATILFAVGDGANLFKPRQPNIEERVHDRRNQEFAAPVRLGKLRKFFGRHVGFAGHQIYRPAQRTAPNSGELFAHLLDGIRPAAQTSPDLAVGNLRQVGRGFVP